MKHRRRIYPHESQTQDINVSPLIDIVFILLIFFIVTTVFVKETGIEVQRPRAAESADLVQEAIFLAVTEDGQVVYAGADIGVHGVRGVLGQMLQRNPNLPVIIQADRSASVDQYVQVHDAVLAAGALQVQLATRRDAP